MFFFSWEFKSSLYYFTWVFHNINRQFDEVVANIRNNKHSYEDPVFNIINDLINWIEITE